ncbi:MAG: aminoglycoside phosphotransferase family protein [Bacillota bacterium]
MSWIRGARNVTRDFLSKALGVPIKRFDVTPVNEGQSGSQVLRISLKAEGEAPPSLILKVANPAQIAPHLVAFDPNLSGREFEVYRRLLPELAIAHAHVYASAIHPETGESWLLLEDLEPSYRFHPDDHVWSEEEIRAILSLYAELHSAVWRGRTRLADHDYLSPFAQVAGYLEEAASYLEALLSRAEVAALLGVAGELVECLWDQLPIWAEELAAGPLTVTYNDFYPPNCGVSADGRAVLIDWQLAGVGLPETDLGNVYSYGDNLAALPFEARVDHYLAEVERLSGVALARERFIEKDPRLVILEQLDSLPWLNALVERSLQRRGELTPQAGAALRSFATEVYQAYRQIW